MWCGAAVHEGVVADVWMPGVAEGWGWAFHLGWGRISLAWTEGEGSGLRVGRRLSLELDVCRDRDTSVIVVYYTMDSEKEINECRGRG